MTQASGRGPPLAIRSGFRRSDNMLCWHIERGHNYLMGHDDRSQCHTSPCSCVMAAVAALAARNVAIPRRRHSRGRTWTEGIDMYNAGGYGTQDAASASECS
eukprot:5805597-Pleurochrysis_carterae.AAC.6